MYNTFVKPGWLVHRHIACRTHVRLQCAHPKLNFTTPHLRLHARINMSKAQESKVEAGATTGWLSWMSWSRPEAASKASDTQAASNSPELPPEASPEQTEKQQNDTPGAAPNFSGEWKKDEKASDLQAYYSQIELFHMSAAYKYVAKYGMWGLDIKTSDEGMDLKYLVKGVPAFVFKEVEHFRYEGPTSMGRRDHRSGQQTATTTQTDGGIQIDITWGEPYAGNVREVYTRPDDNTLHLLSTLTIGGQTVTSLQVYRKS